MLLPQLEATESKLQAMPDSLDQTERKLSALEAELGALEARYTETEMPREVHDDCVRKVGAHNALVDSYNRVLDKYRTQNADLTGAFSDRTALLTKPEAWQRVSVQPGTSFPDPFRCSASLSQQSSDLGFNFRRLAHSQGV